MEELLVIGVATEKNDFLYNWELSLKKGGYKYKIIGLGEKWGGFKWRVKLKLIELKKLNKNIIICDLDTYDVIVPLQQRFMLQKFHKVRKGKPLVCCLESNSNSFNTIPIPEIIYGKMNIYPNLQTVNAGFLIGYNEYIQKFYNYFLNSEEFDDQVGLCNFIKCSPEYFSFDINNELGLNLNMKNDFKEWNFTKNCINKSGLVPAIIHFPGVWKNIKHYNKIIKIIEGTKKCKAPPFSFRFKKFLVELNLRINSNFKVIDFQIIIILAAFILILIIILIIILCIKLKKKKIK